MIFKALHYSRNGEIYTRSSYQPRLKEGSDFNFKPPSQHNLPLRDSIAICIGNNCSIFSLLSRVLKDSTMFPSNEPCPFCAIGGAYPQGTQNFSPALLTPSAFVVLSTPLVIAFLDIMPLSPGHLLLATRRHREKISDVDEEEAVELGLWTRRLSRALMRATGVEDWNVGE